MRNAGKLLWVLLFVPLLLGGNLFCLCPRAAAAVSAAPQDAGHCAQDMGSTAQSEHAAAAHESKHSSGHCVHCGGEHAFVTASASEDGLPASSAPLWIELPVRAIQGLTPAACTLRMARGTAFPGSPPSILLRTRVLRI